MVGAALRIVQWLRSPSLWLDEAAISVNIVERDLAGLTDPLILNQGAPIGWLWIEKVATLLGGSSELVLRFWPMVAGIATLFVVRALARRVCGVHAQAAAVALVAFWPTLVHYSGEVKQYSTDNLAAALAVLLALRIFSGERHSRRHFAVVANVLLWVSHPAAIVVGATLIVVGVTDLSRRDRHHIMVDIATGLSLATSLLVLWLINLSDLASSTVGSMWGEAASTGDSGLTGQFGELAGTLISVFKVAMGPGRLAFVALMALGFVGLAARRSMLPAILAVLGVLAIGLDQMELFPLLRGRFTLYLVPLALVVAASAIDLAAPVGSWANQHLAATDRLARIDPHTALRRGAVIALATVLVTTVAFNFNWFSPVSVREQSRPLYSDLITAYRGEDTYLYLSAGPAYRFYHHKLDLPPVEAAVRLRTAVRPQGERLGTHDWNCVGPVEVRPSPVWLIFSHPDPGLPSEPGELVESLMGLGEVQRRLDETGASALLIDLTPEGERALCRLEPSREGIAGL